MSSSSHTIITIPTKEHDGGNCSALNTIFADDGAQKPKKVDAFAKYSNNLIRMKTLLLLDDDSDSLDYLGSLNEALRYIRVSDRAIRNPGDAMKRRRGNDLQPIQGPCSGTLERKTRLSFELHPDLLLHDLIDLNNSVTIPDDDDDEPKE